MTRLIGMALAVTIALIITGLLGGCAVTSDIEVSYTPVAYFCEEGDCSFLASPYRLSYSTCIGPGRMQVLTDLVTAVPNLASRSHMHIDCVPTTEAVEAIKELYGGVLRGSQDGEGTI